MHVIENDRNFLIQIPQASADFHRKLDAVKKLPGRVWLDAQKMWSIPRKNYSDIKQLLAAINNQTNPLLLPLDEIPIQPMPELAVPVQLNKSMYHFQEQGVAYNIEHGSSLNGDQQGLGKTIETIATIEAMNLFPCLVITKNGLKLNWESEWKTWTDREIMIFTESKKNTWQFFFNTKMADVGIVNYESLNNYFVSKIEVPKGEEFRVKHIHFKQHISLFKSIIIDESHYVKDGKTKRTKFCIGMTRHLKQRGVFLLSGTPVLNDPMELYTQLFILNRAHIFGNQTDFKKRYVGKANTGNLKHLNGLLHRHCYFRRTKQEVRKDMPEKTRQVILCDLDNRDEYSLAEHNFVKYLKEKLKLSQGEINTKLRGEVMVQMGILKKIAAFGKLHAIKEWVNDLIEQQEKIVLFAFHKEIQVTLAGFHPNAVRLGDLPIDVKNTNKQRFQTSDEVPMIVCSISADSEGHTLNAASNLGMCELPWHFGRFEQCEDRIHRITNTLPANISTFLAENTIDRYIYDIIMDKKEMHDHVTGTDEAIEIKVIDKLINIFNQK